jgi:hypothetical protein
MVHPKEITFYPEHISKSFTYDTNRESSTPCVTRRGVNGKEKMKRIDPPLSKDRFKK